jgi:hypothetical protein
MTRTSNDINSIENDSFQEGTKGCSFESNEDLLFLLFLKMA